MLTDPRDGARRAEPRSRPRWLGLAGLAGWSARSPAGAGHPSPPERADDLVHLLLGHRQPRRGGRRPARRTAPDPAHRRGGPPARSRRPGAGCGERRRRCSRAATSCALRVLATARPDGYKEWHHFVVARRPGLPASRQLQPHRPRRPRPAPRLVPRVIVIAHDGRWTRRRRAVRPSRAGRLRRPRRARHRRRTGCASRRRRLPASTVDLPDRDRRRAAASPPIGRPPFVVNNQPLGAGRLNWLFVPRLRADGWVAHRRPGAPPRRRRRLPRPQLGPLPLGRRLRLDVGLGAARRSGRPWSFVFMRMTDRRRLRTLAQALYVWHHDEPAAMFRDAAVRMRSVGLARPRRRLHPAAADAAACSAATRRTCRRSLAVTAARVGDTVQAEFRPGVRTRGWPSRARCASTGRRAVEIERHGPGRRARSAATASTPRHRCVRGAPWLNRWPRCCAGRWPTCAAEAPASYRQLLRELGPLVIEIDVDGERFACGAAPWRGRRTAAERPTPVSGSRTSRAGRHRRARRRARAGRGGRDRPDRRARVARRRRCAPTTR